jgi:predicted sulfurtransferase
MSKIFDKRYLVDIDIEEYDENQSDACVCPSCGESFNDHNPDCALYIALLVGEPFTIEEDM